MTRRKFHKSVPFSRSAVAMGLGAVVLLGAGYYADGNRPSDRPAPVVDTSGKPIPSNGEKPSSKFLEVVIDNSGSDQSQQPLLETRLANIAIAASAQRADVEVVVLSDRTDSAAQVIARAHFAGACAGNDNPACTPDPKIADAFVADVTNGLKQLTPALESDVPGALVYLARKKAELGKNSAVSAVIIGDGTSTVTGPGCDWGLVSLDPSTFTDTAAKCLHGLDLDLGHMNVALAGVGLSQAADANPAVLRATPGLLKALITGSGGVPRLIDLDLGSSEVFP